MTALNQSRYKLIFNININLHISGFNFVQCIRIVYITVLTSVIMENNRASAKRQQCVECGRPVGRNSNEKATNR